MIRRLAALHRGNQLTSRFGKPATRPAILEKRKIGER